MNETNYYNGAYGSTSCTPGINIGPDTCKVPHRINDISKPSKAIPSSDIYKNLDTQQLIIENLINQVIELHQMLQPVLEDTEEINSNDISGRPSTGACTIARMIDMRNGQLIDLVQTINNIKSKLRI